MPEGFVQGQCIDEQRVGASDHWRRCTGQAANNSNFVPNIRLGVKLLVRAPFDSSQSWRTRSKTAMAETAKYHSRSTPSMSHNTLLGFFSCRVRQYKQVANL